MIICDKLQVLAAASSCSREQERIVGAAMIATCVQTGNRLNDLVNVRYHLLRVYEPNRGDMGDAVPLFSFRVATSKTHHGELACMQQQRAR